MRAPDFWHTPGMMGKTLSPLSVLWRAGAALRNFGAGRPWTAPVPVLCVGNLTAGGAGKTPLAIDLTRALLTKGYKPNLLSRGYGGTLQGPVLVDPSIHRASKVGDEPLLLAGTAPTWVSRDRIEGVKHAIENGANIVVMDDGFQNPAIAKTLSILTIDGGYGFGNGRVIPAGPLREPIAAGLARCDAVVIIGEDQRGLAQEIDNACPIYRARIVAYPDPTMAGQTSCCLCGYCQTVKVLQHSPGDGLRNRWDAGFSGSSQI